MNNIDYINLLFILNNDNKILQLDNLLEFLEYRQINLKDSIDRLAKLDILSLEEKLVVVLLDSELMNNVGNLLLYSYNKGIKLDTNGIKRELKIIRDRIKINKYDREYEVKNIGGLDIQLGKVISHDIADYSNLGSKIIGVTVNNNEIMCLTVYLKILKYDNVTKEWIEVESNQRYYFGKLTKFNVEYSKDTGIQLSCNISFQIYMNEFFKTNGYTQNLEEQISIIRTRYPKITVSTIKDNKIIRRYSEYLYPEIKPYLGEVIYNKL